MKNLEKLLPSLGLVALLTQAGCTEQFVVEMTDENRVAAHQVRGSVKKGKDGILWVTQDIAGQEQREYVVHQHNCSVIEATRINLGRIPFVDDTFTLSGHDYSFLAKFAYTVTSDSQGLDPDLVAALDACQENFRTLSDAT